MVNARQKQASYGAVDYLSRAVLLKSLDAGNFENTVNYLRYLQQQSPNQRLLVLWDGASYHRSEVVRQFLAQLNEEQPEQEGDARACEQHEQGFRTIARQDAIKDL